MMLADKDRVRFYSIGKRLREIHVVSPEEEKEGYGGKDLQKRKVSSVE